MQGGFPAALSLMHILNLPQMDPIESSISTQLVKRIYCCFASIKRDNFSIHMLVHMCCRQKDRVPIDAEAKLDHVQFRNKNVEYNHCLGNGLVWDFCIMFTPFFLSAKHSDQNQYIRRIHHKIKKGQLSHLMISKTKML